MRSQPKSTWFPRILADAIIPTIYRLSAFNSSMTFFSFHLNRPICATVDWRAHSRSFNYYLAGRTSSTRQRSVDFFGYENWEITEEREKRIIIITSRHTKMHFTKRTNECIALPCVRFVRVRTCNACIRALPLGFWIDGLCALLHTLVR